MMNLFFGGKKVDLPTSDKFTVDTKTFGDPQYGTYKFLHIEDNKTQTRIIVSENIKIESLANAFVQIPNSQKFEPLENLEKPEPLDPNLEDSGYEFLPKNLIGYFHNKNALKTWGLFEASSVESRSRMFSFESQSELPGCIYYAKIGRQTQPSFFAVHLFGMDNAVEILTTLARRVSSRSQRVVLLFQFSSLHDHSQLFNDWMSHIKSASDKWHIIRIQRVESRYVIVLRCEKKVSSHTPDSLLQQATLPKDG